MPQIFSRAVLKLKYCVHTALSLPPGLVQLRSIWPIVTAPAGAELLAHPAYVPVADTAGLPRVLLIGDSISVGYTLAARGTLKGVANVHRPAENCAHSRNGLQRIGEWIRPGNWDVIHFNFGLHDISLKGGLPVVPPEEYRANLLGIAEILRGTGATLVWASTTPVPRDLHCVDPLRGTAFEQRAADVDLYNRIAAEVMASQSIYVNDLNSLVKPCLAEIQIPDDIHFSKAGDAFLGRHVASCLRPLLASAGQRR